MRIATFNILSGRSPGEDRRRAPLRGSDPRPGRRPAWPSGSRPQPAALAARRPNRDRRRGDGGDGAPIRRRPVRDAGGLVGRDGRGRAGGRGVRRGVAEPLPGLELAGGATPAAPGRIHTGGPDGCFPAGSATAPRRRRSGGHYPIGPAARGEHPPVVPARLERRPAAGPAAGPRGPLGTDGAAGDLNMGRATAERVTGLRPLATGATFPARAPSVQIDHLLATPGPSVPFRWAGVAADVGPLALVAEV